MEIGTPARLSSPGIRDDGEAVGRTAGDHAQQFLLGGSCPATDTRPHRSVGTHISAVVTNHRCQV
jgi:hypothetical protein